MNISLNDKVVYFGAGCGIGLALGLLFSSKSGQEITRNLSDKVDDFAHTVQRKIESSGIRDAASQTLHDVVEKGRNVANFGKRRIQESMQAGSRKLDESMEDWDIAER